jgi:hypothetical protein
MNINKKSIVSSIWFALEVIGIFMAIQLIRFLIGNLDAIYSGISLILITGLLFVVAFLIARSKDNHKPGKPGSKTLTRLLS